MLDTVQNVLRDLDIPLAKCCLGSDMTGCNIGFDCLPAPSHKDFEQASGHPTQKVVDEEFLGLRPPKNSCPKGKTPQIGGPVKNFIYVIQRLMCQGRHVNIP